MALEVIRRNFRCDFKEVVAVVTDGFWEAATRFDPSVGVEFTTYAFWYAKKWLKEFLLNECGSGMHVPARHGVKRINLQSLDRVLPGQDKQETLGSLVADPRVADPGDEEYPIDLLKKCVEMLDGRELDIFLMRAVDGMTCKECGQRLGVTKQRIQQIERGIQHKLQAGFS